MNIVVITDNDSFYTKIRDVVADLEFEYDDTLELVRFDYNDVYRSNIDSDIKKVYIIEVKEKLNVVKYIRSIDFNNEIILFTHFKINEVLCNIFDIIEEEIDIKVKLIYDLKLILKHRCRHKTFNYKNRDCCYYINFENILYVYHDNKVRKCIIVTEKNKYLINKTLKEVFDMLDNRFKQVHRACLVNFNRIEKIDWINNHIIFDNGFKINLLSKYYV